MICAAIIVDFAILSTLSPPSAFLQVVQCPSGEANCVCMRCIESPHEYCGGWDIPRRYFCIIEQFHEFSETALQNSTFYIAILLSFIYSVSQSMVFHQNLDPRSHPTTTILCGSSPLALSSGVLPRLMIHANVQIPRRSRHQLGGIVSRLL